MIASVTPVKKGIYLLVEAALLVLNQKVKLTEA